jgi:hypothetical protein
MMRWRVGERVKTLERTKQPRKFRIGRNVGFLCLALPVVAVIFLSHRVSRPVESTHVSVSLVNRPKVTIIDLEQQMEKAETTTHAALPKLSYTSLTLHDHNEEQNPAHNLWDNSTEIPPWMKEYFRWHAQELRLLTAENYKSQKCLVLRCLATDQTCGGASDRLKPLPILIKLAAQSKRIFFIYWSRPCLLEEFLVPVAGGLNWTVPEWLVPELARGKSTKLYTKVS